MYYSKQIVLCLFSTTTLLLLQITKQANAEQQQQQQQYISVTRSNDCFRQYLESITNVTSKYSTNYKKCIAMGTEMRELYTLEKQSTKEDIISDAAAICTRLHNCNEMASDFDYFQCNAENGYANIANIIAIKLKAYAAQVDLEDKYDDAEKQVLLCIIQQEQNYIQDVMAAYSELALCLGDKED